jgi:hypothetical protein
VNVYRGVALGVAVLAALIVAPLAHALNPPTLISAGHVKRHPAARWTLPPNVEAWSVQVATRPDRGSDGQFFSENVVVFDLVRATDTEWLDADRLKAGTYYVHVRGYDNTCLTPPYEGECGLVWSNVLSFRIVNRAPTLRALRWSTRGHGSAGYSYYVTVSLRMRICDDAAGEITTYRTERKHLAGRTFARSRESDYGRERRAGCTVTRWTWRLEDKFFGVGYYSVRVWVHDRDGGKSRAVTRSWFTAD